MKFKDLFLFLEQEDQDDIVNPELEPEFQLPDVENEPDQPAGMDADDDEPPQEPRAKVKKLSAKDQIKQKWSAQNPGLSDIEMEEAIGFFTAQRPGLRPYRPYGFIDPQTNRHYINVPEITSIVIRFPEMEDTLSDNGKMNDLKNYPWEVMSFFIDIVQANNDVIDEENIVPGLTLPYDEQLKAAQDAFKEPQGMILNEGGIMVHRIESKNESIKFGSIQRVLSTERRKTNNRGNMYWCTTVPLNDKSRSNLWTNYRPQNGFYYIWDTNKNETDVNYFGSIQAVDDGSYTFVDLFNDTSSYQDWPDIVNKYPILQGKENLFPHFGQTPKEREDLTIDQISMTPGHKYYFGTIPESYQNAYVDSGRHVNKVQAFLTMRPATRKLYVDKTSKINNDLQTRFLSNDPNDPFGILEVLRKEKSRKDNLYKYLDQFILKSREQIPEGILGIKRSIIGTNWKTSLRDPKTGNTLVIPRGERINMRAKPKYGVMNIENADIIKDFNYTLTSAKTFLHVYTEEGVKRRKLYTYQRYVYTLGNDQQDNDEQFTFLCLKEALTDKTSPNYMLGQYFEGTEGDAFIQGKLESGELIRI